jgi:MFS transporter, DHA1 family, multidrug resistance protein
MISLAAYLLGIGMPETYAREILRGRSRRAGRPNTLPAAQSGVTLAQMAHITVATPIKMLFTEPIVIACSLYLGLNFAVVFQWFITVPAVLHLVYGFTVQRAGLAFISAIGGAIMSAISSMALERYAIAKKRDSNGMVPIETRFFPAMLGSVLITASLFWVGWTADPKISFYAPITGTAIYVWGNMSVLTSLISYLFDAYPPAGTLSALTAAASFRLICAAIVPIFILDMFANLTGAWALSTFGFISAAMIPIPLALYKFGADLRARSKYSGGMTTVEVEMMSKSGHVELQALSYEEGSRMSV